MSIKVLLVKVNVFNVVAIDEVRFSEEQRKDFILKNSNMYPFF